ncbi:MAG: alpha/beta hydrolase [Parasphingorhabdus sp.]
MTSISAKLFNVALRLAGLKKNFANEEGARRALAKDRANGPAKPSKWLQNNCVIEEEVIDGFLNYHISPKSGESEQRVVYFHGGGYVFDIVKPHWDFLTKLVQRTGVKLTVPIYPLAPEHDWKASYSVIMKLYDGLIEREDSANLVFMGDSAGGGWSLGLAQMLRDQAKPLPSKLVLLSPWLDGKADDPAMAEIEPNDRIISLDGIQSMGRWWAGEDGNPGDFPVSPLFASIDNLPPMIVFTGSHDILHVDANRFHQKAKESGIAIDFHAYPNMQHVWMLFPIKEAKQVIDQIVEFLRR